MNRRLLDPFEAVELPEHIEEYLDHGTALCLAFNRRGTLLASGTKEGQIVIWDFDTRGVASVLSGHEGPVTSVSWSRNGRLLLSGSEDQRVILWRVLDASQVASVQLPSPVVKVSLSPRPPHLAVVSTAEGTPVFVDFASATGGGSGGTANGEIGVEGGRQRPLVEPLPVAGDAAEAPAGRGGAGGGGNSNGGGVAVFSRGGEVVIGAYLRGAACVVDAASRRILDVVRLPSRVSELVLNRKGNLLLATCADQRVRLFEVTLPTRGSSAGAAAGAAAGGEAGTSAGAGVEAAGAAQGAAGAGAGSPEPGQALLPPSEAQLAEAFGSKAVKSGSLLHGPEGGLLRPAREFQNVVERTPWRAAAFSHDSEHVVGAAAAKAQMQLYIWNRPLGNMERLLEGPKEGVLELAWHPQRSLLLCVASSGRIYIWAKVHAENWSAFAPDFKELDENTEYVEREDEFDWNTPGAGGELGPGVGGEGGGEGEGEAAPLDILTRDRLHAFSSDDEGEEEEQAAGRGGEAASELLYLPVVVEPEPQPAKPEEGEGTEAGEEEGDGEELPDAPSAGAPPGRQAAHHQRQQQQQQQQQLLQQSQQQLLQQQQIQQQLLLQQVQAGRLAHFPRRGGNTGGGGGAGGELGGFGLAAAEVAAAGLQGGEAAWALQGLQGQQWARQQALGGGLGAVGTEEAGGVERRRGGRAASEEARDMMTDEMEDGGAGQQPGRKRKVQFDEGALETWR